MAETILFAVVCLLAGAGIAGVAVYLMRDKAADPSEDARSDIAELARQHGDTAARLEAMIGMLNKGQSQLQHHVNERDRKSTRLNSSHIPLSRMPSSA